MVYARWLLKISLLYTGFYTGLLALLALGSGRLLGIALLPAAVWFAEIDTWQSKVLKPPYLQRFPDQERRLIDERYHWLARLALFAWGVVWTLRASYVPLASIQLGVFLVFFGVGLVYLVLNDLISARIASRALTYEHYRLEAPEAGRWLLIIMFITALYLSYRFFLP